MSQSEFKIPKKKDSEIISRLFDIKKELAEFSSLSIIVIPHEGSSEIRLDDNCPLDDPKIRHVLEIASEVMPLFYLRVIEQGHNAIRISRDYSKPFDNIDCGWANWASSLNKEVRSSAFVKTIGLARKYFHVSDLETSLSGLGDSEWSNFKKAQGEILIALEATQKDLLLEYNRKQLESEQKAQAQKDEFQKACENDFLVRRDQLEKEYEQKANALNSRVKTLEAKESNFETKEARYVARRQQEVQMKELQERMKNWSLTPATQQKRTWVRVGYILAIFATGFFTWELNSQNIELLKKLDDVSKLMWWQWGLLSLRSVLPAAAFVAFIVYFIRWTSEWAKQHADEEFLTHSRVLDIGRSSWLLEAVRDAQDHKQELPEFLLKELSRNLFVTNQGTVTDDQTPKLAHELLAGGLNNLRVKSGSNEVEVSKGKKG